MKKLINSKKTIQKILVTIVIMLIFNFIIPNYSQADVGGVLLKPTTAFVTLLGDVICSGLQMFLVDGNFFTGSGSILQAFLVSSNKYDSNTEKFNDYPEINYNDTGIKAYNFNVDDIDEEGIDLFNIRDSIAIPVAKYTPDSIFAGMIPALDINFIQPKDWGTDDMNNRSVASQLHNTIATWYVTLRNLAVVGLMIILVYVGIRMVISSTASDKAKYKQLMLDWLVAMCLLFSLHYIMSFTITITQEITNAINGSSKTVNTIPVIVKDGKGENAPVKVKFNTNLTGLARFQTSLKDGGTKLSYTIIYGALVIYTCMFTFTYLRRVINMAFLTLIAPLVALTYPIDKINDGKAQAFNSWLREYIFNALLQPFHLIIYTVFITSAMELASKNPIYAIVALAFITPAEKILRKFFGFEKSSTAGTLGAFASMAGGAAAYKMLNNTVNRHGGKGGSSGRGGNNIRTKKDRQLQDPNAPSGVDGFTGHNNGASNQGESQNASQRMLDAYDEGFGTDEYDPTEREAMARDAYAGQIPDMQYTNEELRQIYRDSGYGEDEINNMLGASQSSSHAPTTSTAQDTSHTTTTSHESNKLHTTDTTDSPDTTDALDTNTPNTQNKQETQSIPSRPLGRVGAGFAGVGRSIKNKASSTIGNKHWLKQKGKGLAIGAMRGATHIAVRAASAVPTAVVGLAAGIAGDNLEDVLTYGLGGATLGATVLGNRTTAAVDSVGRAINDTVIQGFADGYYGGTRLERQVDRRESELQADQSFMQQINEDYADGKLEGKELKEATARAAKYAVSGVDSSKIGKAMKVEDSIMADLANSKMEEEEKRELARQQATSAAKMAEKIKNPEALVGKKGENLVKSWAEQIKSKNKTLSQDEAIANAKEMMRLVKKIKGI